jgi:hypothetical protein
MRFVHFGLGSIYLALGGLVACDQAEQAKRAKQREIQARLEEESRQLDEESKHGKGAFDHWTFGTPSPESSPAKDQ